MKRYRIFPLFILLGLGIFWILLPRDERVKSEPFVIETVVDEPNVIAFEAYPRGEGVTEAEDPASEESLAFPPDAISDELVVHFDNLDDYYAYLEALEQNGYSALGQIDELLAIRIPAKSLRSINPGSFGARGSFSYVIRQPSPPDAIDPEALSVLHGFGRSARNITSGGPGAGDGTGVLVAVLDSGIDSHPQFGAVEILDLDFSGVGASGPGSDHGTSVASIIAGSEGIAPNAELLNIRVFNETGQASSYDVALGIVEAVNQGAKIINMSLGVYRDVAAMREAVAYAADNGVLMVAAAGNDAINTLPYPAAYDGVIAVTAVDALGQQAIFPNQSAQIDFAAPGVGVLTANTEVGLDAFTGTSAAAPFVSGTLASLMSGKGPLTPQAAVSFLEQHANEAGAPGDDPQFGGGVLDWERMQRHGQRGIVDVALAGVYIPPESRSGTLAAVDVTVENRGTAWLNGAELEIAIEGQETKTFPITSLTVGDTLTRRIHAPIPSSDAEEPLEVRARVLTEEVSDDVRIENNVSVVRFTPAPSQ